jgi:hypothetical protein
MLALLFLPVLYLAIMAIYDAVKSPQPKVKRLTDADITGEMRSELIDKFNMGLAYKLGAKSPLYGWAYMWEYQDFKPPLEMSIATPGERYTFKSYNGNPDLIIQAVKVIKMGIKRERTAAKRQAKLEKQYLKYAPVYLPVAQPYVKPLELEPAMA